MKESEKNPLTVKKKCKSICTFFSFRSTPNLNLNAMLWLESISPTCRVDFFWDTLEEKRKYPILGNQSNQNSTFTFKK